MLDGTMPPGHQQVGGMLHLVRRMCGLSADVTSSRTRFPRVINPTWLRGSCRSSPHLYNAPAGHGYGRIIGRLIGKRDLEAREIGPADENKFIPLFQCTRIPQRSPAPVRPTRILEDRNSLGGKAPTASTTQAHAPVMNCRFATLAGPATAVALLVVMAQTASTTVIPAFTSINVCLPYNVLIQPSSDSTYQYIVDADPGVNEAIDATVQNGALTLGPKGGAPNTLTFQAPNAIKVTVQ